MKIKYQIGILIGFLILMSCQGEELLNSEPSRKGDETKNEKFLNSKIGHLELNQKIANIINESDSIESIDKWTKLESFKLSSERAKGQGVLYFDSEQLRKLELNYYEENRRQLVKQVYYLKGKRVFRICEETRTYLNDDSKNLNIETGKFNVEWLKSENLNRNIRHYSFFDNLMIRENFSVDCAYRTIVDINEESAIIIVKRLIGTEILSDYQITII